MPSVPRLSVGMPVFNGAKWIQGALESLLSQGFGDFELVISDNASTDDTEAICRAIAASDRRVQYHRHAVNVGVYRNYDRVLELAAGPCFKWAACSDLCLDGFFEKCVAVLEARPDVVLVYPRTLLLFSPDGQEPYGAEYDDNLNLEQERPSERFKAYLTRVRLNNVMNGVMRTTALRETPLNQPRAGSDISMIAELSLRGKFIEIPERLFVRRLHPETTGVLMRQGSREPEAGYPGRPGAYERLMLHGHRFAAPLSAPIGLHEKLCVWIYLVRHTLRLLLGVVSGRR